MCFVLTLYLFITTAAEKICTKMNQTFKKKHARVRSDIIASIKRFKNHDRETIWSRNSSIKA